MAKSVKIINPIPGKVNYCTQSRAKQFVKRGIAEFVRSDVIRFTCEDRQRLNAEISAAATECLNDHDTLKRAYNWRGERPVWSRFYRPGQVVS